MQDRAVEQQRYRETNRRLGGRQMNKINRDDMLELTRRMTPKRNCFSRIAGAYFDEEGLVDSPEA